MLKDDSKDDLEDEFGKELGNDIFDDLEKSYKRLKILKIAMQIFVLFTIIDLIILMKATYESGKEDIEENEVHAEIILNGNINEDYAIYIEQTALEYGKEIFEYGINLRTKSLENDSYYMGKTRNKVTFLDTIEVANSYVGYPFANSSDVKDYFTEKRLSELASDKNPSPYGLEKIDDTWCYLDPEIESTPGYVGTIVTSVKKITYEEEIFIATSYFIDDKDIKKFLKDSKISSNDYDTTEEYINAIKDKYTCTEEENEFIIKLEDGKWKIDTQVIYF